MDARMLSARSTSRHTSQPVSAMSSAPSTPRQRPILKASSVESSRIFEPSASIVLVGIRGCGKTSLGYIAARALGRRLVESDDEFERKTGCTRAQFLKRNGQNEEEYRLQERKVMESILANNEKDAVIVCGVGSLESVGQSLLRKFALTHPVVHIVRAPEYIGEWLRIPKESSLMQRLEESDRNHRICSNFEFYNLFDGGTTPGTASGIVSPAGGQRSPRYTGMLQRTQEDFVRFVDLIMGFSDETLRVLGSKIRAAAAAPIDRIYTYALAIEFSQLNANLIIVELECGADAIEIEIRAADFGGQLLTIDSPWITKLSEQIAILRRRVCAPIILHVNRNTLRQQPGANDDAYVELLHLGLRMGVEFLVVDLDLEDYLIEDIKKSKGSTALIGDYMDASPSQLGWDDPSRLRRYTKGASLGCEIVRLSQVASVDEDNIAIRRFFQQATFKDNARPLIAYNVGRLGRVSMCYNTILTPVTHPIFRGHKNSKRQQALLTLPEISRMTYDLGLLDPLQYSLFGANIEYSLSPALHNAGYAACGLPHNYQIHQASKFDSIEELLQDPSFGGCSVSLPYKIEIPKRANSMSPEAQAIGAANTVIPIRASKKDGSSVLSSRAGKTVGFHGENTDWTAIMIVIRRNLSPANQIRSWTSGLVIGAGGMARAAVYALIRLDVPNIFICNRTVTNAEKIAAHFTEVTKKMEKSSRSSLRRVQHRFIVIKSLEEPWSNKEYEQPTIIVSCIPAHQIGDVPAPNLNIPIPWLQSVNGGVIVEIAYKPLVTPLMEQVRRLRDSGRPWVPVSGIEVLPEQAMAQFALMTGRIPPRYSIRQIDFPEIMNQKIDHSKLASGQDEKRSPQHT